MGTIHRQNRKDVEAVPIHNKEVSRKKEEAGERFRSEIDIEGIVFLFEVGRVVHVGRKSAAPHEQEKRKSVFLKILLDLLPVARLRQGEHEQHTRLLRIERQSGNEMVFAVVHFPIEASGSGRNPA